VRRSSVRRDTIVASSDRRKSLLNDAIQQDQKRESIRLEGPRRTSFRAPNLNLHPGFKQIGMNPKFDITKFS
jgi:hypothetical protein